MIESNVKKIHDLVEIKKLVNLGIVQMRVLNECFA